MNKKTRVVKCAVSLVGGAIATQVHAQAQPQGLEEVVVTAQKREETAQAIPIAIDVIGGETFTREGVRDVKDIEKMSTALEINFAQGQATIIGMRGMQNVGYSQTTDTMTAVHMDGAYLGSFYGLNGLMLDLERVEVLAGPQGTLYGRNSSAGAVNLISHRPGNKFEGEGTVEFGSKNTRRLFGAMSVPLSETLSVRLAAQKYTRDPLFNDGGAEQDQWTTRLSAKWTPTDRDEIFGTFDYGKFGGTNDPGDVFYQIGNGSLYALNFDARLPDGSVPASVSAYANSPTLRDPYNILPFDQQRGLVFNGKNQQTNWGAMLQYTHDFGGFSAVAQYSHRSIEGFNQSVFRPAALATALTLPVVQDTNSAELRFLSEAGQEFEWVGGLFYFDSKSKAWNATPAADNRPDPITGLNIPACPCTFGFHPNYGDAYSYAIFGQGTWTPPSIDKLHVTAGVRYSKDWKDAHLGFWIGGVPTFVFGVPGMDPAVQALFAPYLQSGLITDLAQGDNDRTWENVQYKLGVEYELSHSSMVYGSVSTGYKAGALTYGATPELQPEDVLAFEVGTKNRLFSNTLQVNSSAWWYDYKNIEAGATRFIRPELLPPGLPNFVPSTGNVRKANLAGLSADIEWQATRADQFGVSFTYVWSEVKDGSETAQACPAVLTCSVVPPGTKVPLFNEGVRLGDAPKWQTMARYAHAFTFAGGATLTPAVKYQWQSEKLDQSTIQDLRYYPNGRLDKRSEIPSQGVLDASLTFVPASARWDVTAYVHNATDELQIHALSYVADPSNPYFGQTTAVLGEPRTYGVILSARF